MYCLPADLFASFNGIFNTYLQMFKKKILREFASAEVDSCAPVQVILYPV